MCYSVKSFSERNVACMCVSTERITHRVMKKRKQKLYICTDGMLSLVNSWRRDAWCQRETWERPFACYLRNRPYTTASIFISSLETTWLHTFSDTIDKIVSKVNVVRILRTEVCRLPIKGTIWWGLEKFLISHLLHM